MEKQWIFPDIKEASSVKELPDLFLKPDGTRVTTLAEWPAQKEYLKAMLAHYMYGHMPPNPANTRGVIKKQEFVHGGKAIRETVQITCGPQESIHFDVIVIRPNQSGRYPVFVWNQFSQMEPCPIEEEAVCRRQYCIAMFNKEQLAPDSDLYATGCCAKAYPDYDWRAIAIWAWGHSRVADYLANTEYADMDKIIATGHSRGGKAALCACIYDERFALCAANGSGCGGGGCLRFMGSRLGEKIGSCESLGDITNKNRFWYWFCDTFAQYGNHMAASSTLHEEYLPFDLHFVKALLAPRPLLCTEGLDDVWANGYGTQITWRAAEEAYRFLGAGGKNAVHFREGGHAYSAQDWSTVLDFCDNMLYSRNISADYKIIPEDTNSVPALHFNWAAPKESIAASSKSIIK